MQFPDRVYHLAEAANLASIRRFGLLPACELIASAGLPSRDRRQLQGAQRLEHTVLPSGVSIRHQRPMPPAALAACLVGSTPAQWYALVNTRVFFWLDPARLNRQRAACGQRPQVVLTIDAAKLLAVYGEHAALTPINTGNARRKPALRSGATFVPYATWRASGWESEAAALGTTLRKRSHQPVELTFAYALPDIMRFVTSMQPLPQEQQFAPEDF